MQRDQPLRPSDLQARLWPPAIILLTLAIFGGTLLFVNLRLRATLRQQIVGRDAQVLNGVALLQGLAESDPLDNGAAPEPADREASEGLAILVQTERLKEVVVGMKGVVAARLFDAQGGLIATQPLWVSDAHLSSPDLETLRRLEPVSRYHPAARRAELYLDAERTAADQPLVRSLLEVLIPLRSRAQDRLIGATQLLLDGQGVAAEFTALDRHLLTQAAGIFAVGGLLIVAGLGWTFGRLRRAHRLLSDRTADLLKANAELTLAAKTSAVGAVTAHLLHGLKNPLSGLHALVANQRQAPVGAAKSHWEAAAASARRMQDLINDIVRVLRDENGGTPYEVTPAELLDLVAAKAQPAAREAGVLFEIQGTAPGVLSHRQANLIMLILDNLIANALEATPRGKAASLHLAAQGQALRFEVGDQGPGFPEELRPSLFTPGRSSKPAGSGIGLAISKQLANHLGASLELTRSTSQGCTFVLTLPFGVSRGGAAESARDHKDL
jgi:signal transduction histidine kinase